MPLKLNVGLSRKVGLPNYSSLGASCEVELELAGSILQESPEQFENEVRGAYAACAKAVAEELLRQQQPGGTSSSRPGATAFDDEAHDDRSATAVEVSGADGTLEPAGEAGHVAGNAAHGNGQRRAGGRSPRGNGHRAEPAGRLAESRAGVNANGHANGNGNGNGSGHGDGQGNGNGARPRRRAATEKQLSYARQLAAQIEGLGLRRLERLAEQVCGKPLAAISGPEASRLIDTLQAVRCGQLDLDALMAGQL